MIFLHFAKSPTACGRRILGISPLSSLVKRVAPQGRVICQQGKRCCLSHMHFANYRTSLGSRKLCWVVVVRTKQADWLVPNHPPPAGGTLFAKEGVECSFLVPLPSLVKRVAPQGRVICQLSTFNSPSIAIPAAFP